MPSKKVVYVSELEEGDMLRVKTKTCEYWVIMTKAPCTAELWHRADAEAKARLFGVVVFEERIAEGEACVVKDAKGKTLIIFIPQEIEASSLEEIPVDVSSL